ncbi:MAG TPA: HRDC domain-containing protein [Pyrinomonadaceae bacterium]|jgi:superfamily II DNA helicase RecQ
MKCKVFKIHINEEAGNFEEEKFNEFLESVNVSQTFASAIGNEFWSILVFYEKANSSVQNEPPAAVKTSKDISAKTDEPVKSAPEPALLTVDEEQKFNKLKQWRNERAAQDGLPPYMIAPNDSLMRLAASDIKSVEDFIAVKGFGEKRAQKYGEEIIRILSE